MVKIYGTLGPACQDEKILVEMFSLGMTGMRLNLSHVTLAESGELIGKMKRAAESCGVKPQLLIDLQGPELRTGAVAEPILLKNEEIVEICAAADWKTENERNDRCGDMDLIRSATDQKDQKVVEFLEKNREELTETADKKKNSESSLVQNRTSAQRMPARIELPGITIPYLIPGQEILLDDGKIHLKVVENPENRKMGSGEKRRYFAKVLWGGLLKSRKSAAFPGAKINSPTLTKADLENIRLAKEMGVTGVMQPFVRGREDLECVKNALKEAGAKRVLPLNVSGPFHSSLLEQAGEELGKELEQVDFSDLQIPYVTNVTAEYVTDITKTKELLARQVASSVRWQQSMELLIADGVDTFVEIGPGRTLAGFLRKINRGVKVYNVGTWEDVDKVVNELC